jgi:hypothetical protein
MKMKILLNNIKRFSNSVIIKSVIVKMNIKMIKMKEKSND